MSNRSKHAHVELFQGTVVVSFPLSVACKLEFTKDDTVTKADVTQAAVQYLLENLPKKGYFFGESGVTFTILDDENTEECYGDAVVELLP